MKNTVFRSSQAVADAAFCSHCGKPVHVPAVATSLSDPSACGPLHLVSQGAPVAGSKPNMHIFRTGGQNTAGAKGSVLEKPGRQ